MSLTWSDLVAPAIELARIVIGVFTDNDDHTKIDRAMVERIARETTLHVIKTARAELIEQLTAAQIDQRVNDLWAQVKAGLPGMVAAFNAKPLRPLGLEIEEVTSEEFDRRQRERDEHKDDVEETDDPVQPELGAKPISATEKTKAKPKRNKTKKR